jgi:phosphate:Na+ symporter
MSGEADAVGAAVASASGASPEIALFPLVTGLIGGLAIFLFGLEQMTSALKAVAGDRMRGVLARLTTNRFMGMLTGASITAVVQSSSVTTVLLVSFISSGLLSLAQSVGVILGANIGTTVTAQIIAFKVSKFALLIFAVGFAFTLFSRRDTLRRHGTGILGLGLVFLGMGMMGDAMAPLRDYPPFLEWMIRMSNPLVGMLTAAFFTALIQSSSATTGIIIVMASQGLISLPAGIALIFGANVGTCITALLAAIGKPREAVRAAVVHVIFNVLGVLLWIPFITELAEVVRSVSPTHEDLQGIGRLAAETPRQIANAHTLFNVANGFLFLGFSTQLARMAEFLVPDRPLEEDALIRAKYLDPVLIDSPPLALGRVRLELGRLGEQVSAMLEAILPAMLTGATIVLRRINAMDDAVDQLYEQIVEYLGRISQKALSPSETDELMSLMEIANSLESIGDIVETNLVALGDQRIEGDVRVSPETEGMIRTLHESASNTLAVALEAVAAGDGSAATRVMEMHTEVRELANTAIVHQAHRLVATDPNRMRTYSVEMDMIENLKRISHVSRRIARSVIAAPLAEHADNAEETEPEAIIDA